MKNLFDRAKMRWRKGVTVRIGKCEHADVVRRKEWSRSDLLSTRKSMDKAAGQKIVERVRIYRCERRVVRSGAADGIFKPLCKASMDSFFNTGSSFS